MAGVGVADVAEVVDFRAPVGFRTAPHNIDAEQAFLGACLLNNDAIDEARAVLRAEDFKEPVHQDIFRAMLEVADAGQRADPITLRRRFEDHNDLIGLGGGGRYLADLTRAAETVINVRSYAQHIAQLARARRRIDILQTAIDRAYDPTVTDAPEEQEATVLTDLDQLARDSRSEGAYAPMDIVAAMEAPRPVKIWIVDQWVPEDGMTLLAGDGGTGKSLLAQQLANCVAAGRPFLGAHCQRCKVLMIATEDNAPELTIRQQDIAAAMDIRAADVAGWLDLIPRVGLPNILVQMQGDLGSTTPAYHALERYVAETRPGLIILDNIAELLAGDAKEVVPVKYFCSRLSAFYHRYGAQIMLLGHVPKNGAADYYGSFAWKGTVRSHLFLRADDEDTDVRILARPKANYAAKHEGLTLAWRRGVLHAEDGSNFVDRLERDAKLRDACDAFLNAMDFFTARKIALSHSSRLQNYAPKLICEYGQQRGVSMAQLEKAMRSLITDETILTSQELPWVRTKNRPQLGLIRRK